MGYLKTWDKPYKKKSKAPKAPTFILSLIQRKKDLLLVIIPSRDSVNPALVFVKRSFLFCQRALYISKIPQIFVLLSSISTLFLSTYPSFANSLSAFY